MNGNNLPSYVMYYVYAALQSQKTVAAYLKK